MDCGPPEKRMNCWTTFVTPGAPKMHDDASVYHVPNEVSKDWGHKSALHVHSSGIWMLKWTTRGADCSPSKESDWFSKENERPRVDLGAQSRGRLTKDPRPYLRFPWEKVRFLEF